MTLALSILWFVVVFLVVAAFHAGVSDNDNDLY
jgi:hypothetical protein